ncbi:MAG: type I restriction endonuclease, partial [Bacteroidales bacterium]
MTPITENSIEEFAIELLEKLGYESVYGPDIAPDNEFSTSFGATSDKRESYEQVLLNNRLRKALKRINRNMPADVLEDAIKEIQRIHSPELLTNNETFHRFLTEGIPVSKRVDGEDRGDLVWLIDFKNPYNNDFLVVNQFTVVENNHPKRPDIVLFV